MARIMVGVLGLALAALPALGDQYWVTYEGNDFPENEGWERSAYAGGAQRSIENGSLVLDGRASLDIADFYSRILPAAPGPGEVFVAQWRMRVEDEVGYMDPGMLVSFQPQGAVALCYNNSAIYSILEGAWVAGFAPALFHDYSLTTSDMSSYLLYVDGQAAYAGHFIGPWNESALMWGDATQGASSLSTWDYVRFGSVPEPSVLLLFGPAGGAAVLSRAQRARRCSNERVQCSAADSGGSGLVRPRLRGSGRG
jgi:hypothetical protein